MAPFVYEYALTFRAIATKVGLRFGGIVADDLKDTNKGEPCQARATRSSRERSSIFW